MSFVFLALLPQGLLRLRLPALLPKSPAGDPTHATSRDIVALSWFVLTCLALIGYVSLVLGDLPAAWGRSLDRMSRDRSEWVLFPLMAGPPLAALVCWCVASWWLLRPSRFGRGSRIVWAAMLALCTLGFPLSCIFTKLGNGRADINWIAH